MADENSLVEAAGSILMVDCRKGLTVGAVGSMEARNLLRLLEGLDRMKFEGPQVSKD